MSREYSKPNNPELFACVLTGLRLAAGEREPQNDLERSLLEAMRGVGLETDISKPMINAFENKPENDRNTYLGPMAKRGFIVPDDSGATAGGQDAIRGDGVGRTFGRIETRSAPTADAHNTGVSTVSTARVLGNEVVIPPDGGTVSTGETETVKYIIRYVGLWCQDETNGPGSDEIYIVTQAAHTNKEQTKVWDAIRHPVNWPDKFYGDVDRGNEFDGPMAVVWWGNPDRVDMVVTVFEHDHGDPDKYREEIDYLVKGVIAIAGKFYPPALVLQAVSGTITDIINWMVDTGDDLLSTEPVSFTREQLEESTMVKGRAYYMGTKSPGFLQPAIPCTTKIFQHFVTKHRADGAEYVIGFDIERDPPPPSLPIG